MQEVLLHPKAARLVAHQALEAVRLVNQAAQALKAAQALVAAPAFVAAPAVAKAHQAASLAALEVRLQAHQAANPALVVL